MNPVLASIGCAALLATSAGCESFGRAERRAVYGGAAGAAAGAVAGEVISGDPLVGAAIGAVGGAIVGCVTSKECFDRSREANDRHYDEDAGRYYFVDPETGDTWWENGEFRSYGPGRP